MAGIPAGLLCLIVSTLILCFHRVADQESGGLSKLAISPEDFNFVLDTVGKKYDFVSLAEGVKPSRQRLAVVTFDDGYADNLHTAGPILQKSGIPATFFITTGFIGTQQFYLPDTLDVVYQVEKVRSPAEEKIPELRGLDYWAALEKLSGLSVERYWAVVRALSLLAGPILLDGDSYRRPMTEKELKALASLKDFRIGPHTDSHRRLSNLDSSDAFQDVFKGISWLEKRGHNPLEFFAYPFGQRVDSTLNLTEMIRREGFEPLSTRPYIYRGKMTKQIQRSGLPRLSVGPAEIGPFDLVLSLMSLLERLPKLWLQALRLRRFMLGLTRRKGIS